MGANVRKGEHGSLVVYANSITKTETNEKGEDTEREIPFMKGYTVFKAEQVDGLPAHYYAQPVGPLPLSERIENAARFMTNTALHQLTHWTSHERPLERDFNGKRFGDEGYAREELVAELRAAFLCADLGITPEIRDDHAANLAHWLKMLKEDKRAIFSAAATRNASPIFSMACSPNNSSNRKGMSLWMQHGFMPRPEPAASNARRPGISGSAAAACLWWLFLDLPAPSRILILREVSEARGRGPDPRWASATCLKSKAARRACPSYRPPVCAHAAS